MFLLHCYILTFALDLCYNSLFLSISKYTSLWIISISTHTQFSFSGFEILLFNTSYEMMYYIWNAYFYAVLLKQQWDLSINKYIYIIPQNVKKIVQKAKICLGGENLNSIAVLNGQNISQKSYVLWEQELISFEQSDAKVLAFSCFFMGAAPTVGCEEGCGTRTIGLCANKTWSSVPSLVHGLWVASWTRKWFLAFSLTVRTFKWDLN